MQKKISFILVFYVLLSSSKVFAQFFGLLEKNPEQYYLKVLREPRDGNYRVANARYSGVSGLVRKNQILTFNSNFQLVDSLNLMRGVAPSISEPLKIGNKLYWPAIVIDTTINNSPLQKLVVLELDLNYHLLVSHDITGFENAYLFLTNLVFHGGRFYLNRGYIFSAPSTIFKLDSQFNILSSVTYTNSWITEMHSFSNNLLVKGLLMPSPCNTNSLGDKMLLDTNLNILNCTSVSNFNVPSPYSKIIPISNTKLLAVGFNPFGSSPSNNYSYIVNTIFNQNNQIVQSQNFQFANKHTVYVDNQDFAAIENGKIITVGCIGFDPAFVGLAQPQPSRIFVNKLDTSGNLIWQKEYGGDMYYGGMNINFTTDGGCLISGLRYDSAKALYPGIMQSFLLKLDANGNYSNVGFIENGNIKQQTISCFPNPVTSQVFFDVPFQDNIAVTFYGSNGSVLLNIADYQNLSSIDISSFQNGLYFYRLTTKNNCYQGKFVKK
jgi:hypothetical protein